MSDLKPGKWYRVVRAVKGPSDRSGLFKEGRGDRWGYKIMGLIPDNSLVFFIQEKEEGYKVGYQDMFGIIGKSLVKLVQVEGEAEHYGSRA